MSASQFNDIFSGSNTEADGKIRKRVIRSSESIEGNDKTTKEMCYAKPQSGISSDMLNAGLAYDGKKTAKPGDADRYFGIIRTISGDGTSTHWETKFQSYNRYLRYLELRNSNSDATKETTRDYIHWLCLKTGKNPDELVLQPKSLIQKQISELAEEKVLHTNNKRYGNQLIKSLIPFFRENGFRAQDGNAVFVPGFGTSRREYQRKEKIPTVKEALKMAHVFGYATRNSVMIQLLTFLGLRNSTLRALTIGQVKSELEGNLPNVAIYISETMKKVVKRAAKNRLPYWSITPSWVTEELRAYIKRLEETFGAELSDDFVLFPTRNTRVMSAARWKTPISDCMLQNIVKESARLAGIENWQYVTPHKLRKTFESFLTNQPKDSRLDRKDQELQMGHVLPGSQDHYHRPPLEELRQKVAKLVVEETPPKQETKVIHKIAMGDDELLRTINEGWDLETALGNDKYLVKKEVNEKENKTQG